MGLLGIPSISVNQDTKDHKLIRFAPPAAPVFDPDLRSARATRRERLDLSSQTGLVDTSHGRGQTEGNSAEV